MTKGRKNDPSSLRYEGQAAKKVWIIFIVSEMRKDIISDLQPDGKSKRRC